jgi:hypothetical protein
MIWVNTLALRLSAVFLLIGNFIQYKEQAVIGSNLLVIQLIVLNHVPNAGMT